MSKVTKVADYAADRASLSRLERTAKKTIEETKYTSPFAPTDKISEVAKKAEEIVHPDAAAYQAHYAPYVNGKANGEDVVQSLTNPRQHA